MEKEYTISEISNALKRAVEGGFSSVRVKGEISGFKQAASGHMYFNLKDENAVLNSICWRGTNLSVTPEDGMEVICNGRITTYPSRSNYQIIIEKMEVSGAGALMALFEKRKKQLAAEGLFDKEKKKKLPFLPETIGVITSPTGAVFHDILHRIEERFGVHVILFPVPVQGGDAAGKIAHAIEWFNHSENIPDLLIVARGGGSLEDLWAFNEEVVVRAVYGSKIPIISAVGHETDITLIDYAADRRAPTPTAAAEIAVPVRSELLNFVNESQSRLFSVISRFLNEKKSYIEALSRGLLSPKQILETKMQRLDDISERLVLVMPRLFDRLSEQVVMKGKLLESFHYQKTLNRGFTVIRDSGGDVLTSSINAKNNMNIEIEFKDGKRIAVVNPHPNPLPYTERGL